MFSPSASLLHNFRSAITTFRRSALSEAINGRRWSHRAN
jgi:hypothetical protein